jgi:hypothetical protein
MSELLDFPVVSWFHGFMVTGLQGWVGDNAVFFDHVDHKIYK